MVDVCPNCRERLLELDGVSQDGLLSPKSRRLVVTKVHFVPCIPSAISFLVKNGHLQDFNQDHGSSENVVIYDVGSSVVIGLNHYYCWTNTQKTV